MKRATQFDTAADVEVRKCTNADPPKCFIMTAGAGSGKTTSLIKALDSVVSAHGSRLRKARQQVACITYTDIAAQEIWEDVGNNPLVEVKTIHSFLWKVVNPFQRDIAAWVEQRVDEKISKLKDDAAGWGARVQQKTKEKNFVETARLEKVQTKLKGVRTYRYGTGSDYVNGILGHDDIIKMAPQFLTESPEFRALFAQRFPFLFVDESQDTFIHIVDCLKAIAETARGRFCLGFFGDPMQKIYATGVGDISAEAEWVSITKPENFRCPTAVLQLANAIRRDGDGLVQVGGRMEAANGELKQVEGSARCFILPGDERRDAYLEKVRKWVARENNDPEWGSAEPKSVKLLVLVHRMAAKRLGFENLFAALNDKAPEEFKTGLQEGTAWPVRPFLSFVLPLVSAFQEGRSFDVMSILRTKSSLVSKSTAKGSEVAQLLSRAGKFTEELVAMMEPGAGAAAGDVLRFLDRSCLLDLDTRILAYIRDQGAVDATGGAGEESVVDPEEQSREASSMEALLSCAAKEFWGYRKYVEDESPFSTQQGIKGAQFQRVLVVLDDEEGKHNQFSYGKYFGIVPPSKVDIENEAAGEDTTIKRTRRLFYVCCTRALQDLVVVLFSPDVALAEQKVRASSLFPDGAIYSAGALD